MAYFSKEIYERKNEYAAKRMQENTLNKNLTEEQHEALAKLCKFRHEWHCNYKSVFCSESAKARELGQYLAELDDNGYIIAEGLPKLTGFDVLDLNDDNLAKENGYDLSDNTQYDEYYSHCIDQYKNVNDCIEKYLAEIDKKYGTNYCPSGLSREGFQNTYEESIGTPKNKLSKKQNKKELNFSKSFSR